MQWTDRSLVHVALPVVVLVVAINFVTMPAEEYPGDANALRAETVTLLNTGKWAIPADIAPDYGPRGQYLYQNAKGNWYPKYGVLNTLIYLPPLWLEKIATGDLVINSTTRVWFLNLLNVALSGASALYLILLARRYTRRRPACPPRWERQSNGSIAIISIFVLASIYSTFWWNYLRVQTFETYQTWFMLAFYYHFVSALDSDQAGCDERKRKLLVAAIYFGALVLSKTVYVALLPAIAAILLADNFSIAPDPHQALRVRLSLRERIRAIATRRREVRAQLLFFWVPVALFLGVLAITNWYKFDSPFATGYTQWEKESQLFRVTNVLPALGGFLFSGQHSVFLHFPLLVFALAGWPMFFKKHKLDALAAAVFAFALLLVSSMFINWRGESSYGPRYLLPILPIVSLPFISYLEWLTKLSNKIARSFLAAGTAVLLAYSTLLQVGFNTLPFFFCYDLKEILDDKRNSKPALYLRSHYFGTISRNFLLYKFGYPSPLNEKVVHHLNLAETEKMYTLTESVRANYYWFPNAFGRVDQ